MIIQNTQHPNKTKYKHIYITLLFYLGLVSCAQEETFYTPEIQDSEVTIQMKIDTPAEAIPKVSTRSQTENEAKIQEIKILVFKDNKFQYMAEGQITSSTVTSTIFTVVLNASSDPLTLYLVANSNSIISSSGIAVNDSKTDVKEKLTTSFTDAGISHPFPMFGERDVTSISSSGNNITGIKMLRSIARADVTMADEVTNFELVSIQLFRANSGIQIIPDAMTDATVTSPSIPAGSVANIGTLPLTVTGNKSESQLYIPESEAPLESNRTSDATCIVIGGKYNGSSTTTYYRMDFNPGITGHPFGQILRNHKYIFNIKKVGVEGTDTPEDAANSQADGVTVEVESWNENITDIHFGDDYFGISSRNVTLHFRANSIETLDIETNLSDITLQWCNENGIPESGIPSSTIANTQFSAAVASDNSHITITALTNNIDTQDKIQYMIVSAGSVTIKIKITQLKYSDSTLAYIGILNIGHGEGTLNTSANGMRFILENEANFGSNGTVSLGGLSIDYCDNPSSLTKAVFRTQIEKHDILYITAGIGLDANLSTAITEWLEYKPTRVLFINKNSTEGYEDLCDLLCSNSMWNDINNNTLTFNFIGKNNANDYFTNSGPFGAVSNPNKDGFSLIGDSWKAAGINPSSLHAQNLIPILYNTWTDNIERYTLAVDPEARIVYIGNPYIWNLNKGLNSSTGDVDTDAARVMANLWAWAIEEVVLAQ
jgi:hypothetical protein